MKNFILAATLLLSAVGLSAQPLLVGHRGSNYGVENTEEAFRNGAKLGYPYLETDIKVTKDIQFILTHDDDVSRFNSSGLTIAGATLAELQALELTQTRLSTKYTGKYMSLPEFLDLCAELNVRPVIELKWATGVNSNDQSNMPKLIQVIEEKGFRNKCVILTSMKPCLEWIRTNHPDITLQFLCNSLDPTGSNFEWCVKWGIDADIRSDGCNKNTVQKLHDAGLKANMWTTNDEAGYKTYGNMGCDFITTDRLDGNNLPDLDESVIFPPNTTDYPNLDIAIKGEYTPELLSKADFPGVLADLTIKRAVMVDGQWVVLAHNSDKAPTLVSVDPANGAVETISTEGVEGGDVLLSDIAATADGKLIACNTATVPFDGGGDVLKVYIWDALNAAPSVLTTVDAASMLGNWSNAYAGDTWAVSGRSNDLQLYIAARSASGTVYRIAGLKVVNGVIDSYCYALDNSSYTQALWGTEFLFTITPTSRNNFLVDSPLTEAIEYAFDWNGTRIPMTEVGRISTTIAPVAASGVSYMRRGIKTYAVVNNGSNARVYDSTDGVANFTAVTPDLYEDAVAESLIFSALKYDANDEATYIYSLSPARGLVKMLLDKTAGVVEEVKEVDMVFERVWINSNTTDNAPEHIDGTNAKQGTAVNGLFYVNDSSDKLIYIFDQSGCIGSIPGGAGWGCTRDDAGNIIVRDENSTSASHTLIIYPAGVNTSNYGTPVTLDVTLNLEGQTDFINASGDVLNGSGKVYFYPKGQTKADVVSIEKGAVTSVKTSGDLNYTATSACYIVPNGNDNENFYYQLRGSGVCQYNGGQNLEILTTKATTTPPGRNSTGGFAFAMIQGNQILVHNSGANYKGGMTARNLTTNEVIATFTPIGKLGYEAGGNYSTFNWIIAEKVDNSEYTIYQYCPANGMARYRLYDNKTSSVDDVALGAENELTGIVSGDILSLAGIDNDAVVEIYNLAGTKVLEAQGIDINVANLAAGVYIVRVGNKTLKIAK